MFDMFRRLWSNTPAPISAPLAECIPACDKPEQCQPVDASKALSILAGMRGGSLGVNVPKARTTTPRVHHGEFDSKTLGDLM